MIKFYSLKPLAMSECIECGAYTKFEGKLCKECYYKKKGESKGNGAPKNLSSEWTNNLIKGRKAETLVEELFLKLGFQIFKYGMENTISGIIDILKGVKDEMANEIRRMPVLAVNKEGHAHFIEIKLRKNNQRIYNGS